MGLFFEPPPPLGANILYEWSLRLRHRVKREAAAATAAGGEGRAQVGGGGELIKGCKIGLESF